MASLADQQQDSDVRFRRKVAEKFFRGIENDNKADEEEKKLAAQKPKTPFTIPNVLWVVGAIAVFYYLDLPMAVLYDPRVLRTWLNIGILFIGANIGIASYLIIGLSWIRKISSDDWDQHHPAAIPIATACFAFGSLCVTIGLWPIWGWWTPVVLFTQLMGVVIVIAMLPNGF